MINFIDKILDIYCKIPHSMNVLWIRSDLRIRNNVALANYSSQNNNLFSFYIYDEKKFSTRSAQKWWLVQSLTKFEKDLASIGVKFKFFEGAEEIIFKKILDDFKVTGLFYNKIDDPDEIKIENKIIQISNKKNLEINAYPSNLLQDPLKTNKADNTPFQVFTPYWKSAEEKYVKLSSDHEIKLKKNAKITNDNKKNIEKILPKKDWFKKFEKYWVPGEENAKKTLNEFIKNKISNYHKARDIPSVEGTSKLSPYLAFGEINVKDIFSDCLSIKNKSTGYRKYINEIGWREFAYHLINHFPTMKQKNLRSQFDNFPWIKNEKFLKRWKKGQTGYPIVDAGMRELYETGWMHNRLRMIVGSFLVKHLRIHWLEGEKYFQDSLLDYDPANNVAGWQWIAGCGADAAPYFRIFNPMLQGEKFDPDGIYVKKWVPEIKNLPKEFIHKPWEMTDEICAKIKFNLKKDYFEPIVDHTEARNAALQAFQSLKK